MNIAGDVAAVEPVAVVEPVAAVEPVAPVADADVIVDDSDVDVIVDDVIVDDVDGYDWAPLILSNTNEIIQLLAQRTAAPRDMLRYLIREYHGLLADLLIRHGSVKMHGLGVVTLVRSRPIRGSVIEVDPRGVSRILKPNGGYAVFRFEPQGAFGTRARGHVREAGRRLL